MSSFGLVWGGFLQEFLRIPYFSETRVVPKLDVFIACGFVDKDSCQLSFN